jgi:hypothetical protein
MPESQQKAPLSVHRAFVVHFRLSTNVEQGPFEGRVTHVVSGQAVHFSSLDELLDFMARVLSEESATEPKFERR